MIVVRIVAWSAIAYVLMGAVEYVVHRWFMHRPVFVDFYERHAVIHHGYYNGGRFSGAVDLAARWVGVDAPPLESLLGLSPVWFTVLCFSRVGGITLAVFIALHSVAWTAFHREMHDPKNRWFSRTAYFRWVARYHAVHHMRRNTNFTALCPLFDFICGTYGGVDAVAAPPSRPRFNS